MANKQRIPSVNLGGANLKENIRTTSVLTDVKSVADENDFSLWKTAVDVGHNYLSARHKLEQKNLKLKAAATLGIYQNELSETTSLKDFDELCLNSAARFEKDVKEENGGDDFWCECGAEMLADYQTNAAALREDKEREFGRNCLDNMLADSENIFANATIPETYSLLKQGLDEIDTSPFLEDEQRNDYREHYLKTAVLNMALTSPLNAKKALKEYLADDADLKQQIEETEKLAQLGREKALNDKQRQNALNGLTEACALWQKKEEGVINEAQYYVLTAGKDKVFDEAENNDNAIVDAYRFVKSLNNKENFATDDLKAATVNLALAYKQGKLGLDETSALQNQLLLSTQDKTKAKLLFDKTPDILADKILTEDTSSNLPEAKIFMEEKAKTAFEIYDTYYTEKTTLADDFLKSGGVITAGVLKKLSRDALNNVYQMFGFAETKDVYSFEELNQMLNDVASVEAKKRIWQKFAEEAPYAQEKKELMAKLVKNAVKTSALV